MPEQHTIVIDRHADEVFAFFADHTNDQKWRSHLTNISAAGPPFRTEAKADRPLGHRERGHPVSPAVSLIPAATA